VHTLAANAGREGLLFFFFFFFVFYDGAPLQLTARLKDKTLRPSVGAQFNAIVIRSCMVVARREALLSYRIL